MKTARTGLRFVRCGGIALLAGFLVGCASPGVDDRAGLLVGAAAITITPAVGPDEAAVWIGGYRQSRAATGVHDELFARAIVVDDGGTRIALVAVDLVGFFLEQTENVRRMVAERGDSPGVDRVVVASTHNHESPDTLGLWGPSRGETGIHLPYQRFVEKRIVEAIVAACDSMRHASLGFGEARADGLIVDSRFPEVIDERVLVMEATDSESGETIATLINFASHVEMMGRDNTRLTADYPAYLIDTVESARGGVALFFPGAVGGMQTPRGILMPDPETGEPALKDSFRNAELYGRAIGRLALEAIETSRPSSSAVVEIETLPVAFPLDNERFQAGVAAGIIGGGELGPRFEQLDDGWKMTSEVGLARIGDALFLMIPGEIYPELILGGIPDPAVPGVDFPDAPPEPAILPKMTGSPNFILGLANDEIGYIIPRRQWDEAPPYAYDRDRPQYGERNSPGPGTAPAISAAFEMLWGRFPNPPFRDSMGNRQSD